MTTCERISELISGYLDDELSQGDRQRVEIHLKDCSSCRKTFQDMKQLRDAVSLSSVEVELSREQLEAIMGDLPARTSSGIGWILLLTGVIGTLSFVFWQLAIDDEIPAAGETGDQLHRFWSGWTVFISPQATNARLQKRSL